jgi:type I restriction-modification system DNA methylase subunit
LERCGASDFGTLLERAHDERERHSLGAHYTPRAYVERLVIPTVVEPLRENWRDVQAAALTLERASKTKEAIAVLMDFRRLCSIEVLDPACGSGNFLYVTLEHLKRLEAEINDMLESLGETQQALHETD